MKNYKNTSLFICLIFFIMLTVIIGQQIFYDPFFVFEKLSLQDININKDNSFYPYNSRYLQAKYIMQHPEKFDSFLFGGSSASAIVLQHQLNGNWYSFTPGILSLWEAENLLEEFKNKNIKIKNVLIELSDENLKNNETGNYSERCSIRPSLDLYPYPRLFSEKVFFYGRYCLIFPIFKHAFCNHDDFVNFAKNKINKIKSKNHNDSIYEPTSTDISYDEKTNEERINLSKEDILLNLPMINAPFIEERLSEIEKIKNFAQENNINIVFFMSPLYYTVYQEGDIKDYNDYKRKIAEITPFYDFSGINPITKDKNYFIDLIHFKRKCGTLMLDRMFSQNKEFAPKIDGFGVYVTTKNIDEHIKNLNEQIKQ